MSAAEDSEALVPKHWRQFLVRLAIAIGCVQFGNFALVETFRDGMGFIIFIPAWAFGLGIWGAAAIKVKDDREKLVTCIVVAVALAISIIVACSRVADLSAREERTTLPTNESGNLSP